MSLEEEVRRAAYVLDTQRTQLEGFAQQQELLRARETITRTREAGQGAEVLVPTGGGAFLCMTVKDDKNALMNVGSDLVFAESIDKVIDRLDARIKEMEDANKSVAERILDVDNRVKVQTKYVQDLYDRLKKETSKSSGGQ